MNEDSIVDINLESSERSASSDHHESDLSSSRKDDSFYDEKSKSIDEDDDIMETPVVQINSSSSSSRSSDLLQLSNSQPLSTDFEHSVHLDSSESVDEVASTYRNGSRESTSSRSSDQCYNRSSPLSCQSESEDNNSEDERGGTLINDDYQEKRVSSEENKEADNLLKEEEVTFSSINKKNSEVLFHSFSELCQQQAALNDVNLLHFDEKVQHHPTDYSAAEEENDSVEPTSVPPPLEIIKNVKSKEERLLDLDRLSRTVLGGLDLNLLQDQEFQNDEKNLQEVKKGNIDAIRHYRSPFHPERQRKRTTIEIGSLSDRAETKRIKYLNASSLSIYYKGTLETERQIAKSLGGWETLLKLKDQIASIDRDLLEKLVLDVCTTDPSMISKIANQSIKTTERHYLTSLKE